MSARPAGLRRTTAPARANGVTTRRRIVVGVAWAVATAGAANLLLAGVVSATTFGSDAFRMIFAALSLAVMAYAGVGAVLTLRRPDNRIGAILLAAALMLDITFLGFIWSAVLVVERGTGDVAAAVMGLAGGLTINATLVIAGPAIALVFPDGRLPSPRWRWPVRAIAAVLVGAALPNILRPGPLGEDLAINPFAVVAGPGVDALIAIGDALGGIAVPGALLLAIVAVAVRFRGAAPVERHQLKWFVGAYLLVVVLLLASLGDGASGATVFDVLAVASLSLPPMAIGIAVLRYRLYEIDRIISRTIGWAIVTGLLVAVFAGGVIGLQAALAGVTQGQTLAVAASTLLAFALFQPVRGRIQGAVDRRFDRARVDAQQIVDAFAGQLRDELDLAALVTGTTRTAAGAVRPAGVSLWLRDGSVR